MWPSVISADARVVQTGFTNSSEFPTHGGYEGTSRPIITRSANGGAHGAEARHPVANPTEPKVEMTAALSLRRGSSNKIPPNLLAESSAVRNSHIRR